MDKAYLEDLAPGQVFTSPARAVVGADAIKRFAGEFDPQPWHLNETIARSSLFKELVASGWHTTALTMQLIIQTLPLSEGIIGRWGRRAALAASGPARPPVAVRRAHAARCQRSGIAGAHRGVPAVPPGIELDRRP